MAQKLNFNKNGVSFSDISQPSLPTGQKITAGAYKTDDDDNIISTTPVLNAIDIDWNNATYNGLSPISSTADLIKALGEARAGQINEKTKVEVGPNGNWWIDGVDTGIKAEGRNGLSPWYDPETGAWYIGDEKICDGDESMTPYIKDGYWWIGDHNTGVPASGSAGNCPYVKDGYWWIGDENTGVPATSPGSEGDTPYIGDNGNWWIGNHDTGIRATASDSNSTIITIGENGNWYINGRDTGKSASKTTYIGGGGDGNSIPIYDADTEERLKNENLLPSKYIALGDSYNLDSNTTLMQNLMSVVTELQKEVNKLKNTFHKGIYSYNDEATYMSATVANYGDVLSEEPIWAIDENSLTPLNGEAVNSVFIDTSNNVLDCQAQRLYAYFTCDSSNVEVTLCAMDDPTKIYSFNLNTYVSTNKCNVTLIVSRKPLSKEYPENYIFFTVSDYNTNYCVASGYLNSDKLLFSSEKAVSERYSIYKIDMTSAGNVEKFNLYYDDKELGSKVLSNIPEQDEDSYRVAHIAVRSCKNYSTISKIAAQLVDNELIFDENTAKLYIKSKGKIINIGASSGSDGGGSFDPGWGDTDDNMTNQEILKALYEQGIISINFKNPDEEFESTKFSPSNIISYELNSIGSVKFVHEETGKTFEFKTNENGQLESKELTNDNTIATYLNGTKLSDDYKNVRGVIGQVGNVLYAKANGGSTLGISKDFGIYADRIKIGAMYCPKNGDLLHGCSHGYIELENSSPFDYNLTGCSLHFIRPNAEKTAYIDSQIKLTGTIYAGSTYLIRGKQYTNADDPHCYIKVNTYDQEWYDNKKLIDFTVDNATINGKAPAYIFVLMWDDESQITKDCNLWRLAHDPSINTESTHKYLGTTDDKSAEFDLYVSMANDGSVDTTSNSAYVYAKGLIDAVAIGAIRYGIAAKGLYDVTSNCIYKNTFELDPAKQAFNGLTTRDSSRQRWGNNATDYMYLSLNSPYIEFKKSEERYPIEYFTPKASFENKNVCTDKTKFNYDKPNAVSVGFGENMYVTRTFNWISSSDKDEYVWIYNEGGSLLGKFESYKTVSDDSLYTKYMSNSTYPVRVEFPQDVNNIVYCDNRKIDIVDESQKNKDVTYKEYRDYKRLAGLFAASNDFYVSHKCIVKMAANAPSTKTKYFYVVGQADKNGNPDPEHTSEKRIFHTYPTSAVPKIYHITDQQGFHWIEYQVWAATAVALNDKIEEDIKQNPSIMPVILNTGDCTQSGSRVNEWLDYFNAGDVLFNHFEQNNIVGNNDLNGTDIQYLGTGDDPGKSNAYYFYIFNCCEVNNFFTSNGDHWPIVNGVYLPSLYYIQTNKTRIVMLNSEFTIPNCRDWFGLKYNGNPVNIYTGFTNNNGIKQYAADKSYAYDKLGFTPVYTLLYHAFNKSENGNRNVITVCHEMPFTVITNASVKTADSNTQYINQFRSINTNGTSLVGSHMNQMNNLDDGPGIYWFSRLMESMKVKLCIGGHKHTYTSTYPLREYYKYRVGSELRDSKKNGPMTMTDTLKDEEYTDNSNMKVIWSWKPEGDEYPYQSASPYSDNINWSKLPLTYREPLEDSPANGSFFPAVVINDDAYKSSGVVYVMCQATGYKLTSNKELPTASQKFSRLVPQTAVVSNADTPDNNQKFPMFMTYDINETSNLCTIKLARVANVFTSNYKFTQSAFEATKPMQLQWLIEKSYYKNENLSSKIDKFVFLSKYSGDNTNYADELKSYYFDNFGLWFTEEHKMIDDITL